MSVVAWLLVGVLVMLWWIRSALEPIRSYFAGKLTDLEMEADEARFAQIREDAESRE